MTGQPATGAIRLMIYDSTCLGRIRTGGLSRIWRLGGAVYRALGRFDRVCGASSWAEALDFLATAGAPTRIAEIQFWGHGKWGAPRIGTEVLARPSLSAGHPLYEGLRAVRDRLVPGGQGLWWFRACETFGAIPGQEFARAFTEFFGCRAAGHTYIISFFQSGLHTLRPGEAPYWPTDEGLRRGTPEEPLEAHPSTPGAPHTITCLRSRLPDTLSRRLADPHPEV